MLVFSESLTFQNYRNKILLDCPAFKIAVDNNNIFSVEGFRLLKVPNSEALKTARANVEGFVASTNTLW